MALMEAWRQIVARAWEDESFKQKLLDDPDGVLVENGINLPGGVHAVVVENEPSRVHFVIPTKDEEQAVAQESSDAMAEYNAACA